MIYGLHYFGWLPKFISFGGGSLGVSMLSAGFFLVSGILYLDYQKKIMKIRERK